MADIENVSSSKKSGIEYRKNSDGSTNAKYIDILEEDRPIAAQKFVCMSFVSPEKIIKQRETFMFNEYIKQWEMNKSLEKFNHFISFISYKYSLDNAKVMSDLEDFCKTEKENLFLTTLEDEYKTFLDNNEEKLNETFQKTHSFRTNVRGVKVRGSFPTQDEAEMRCKMLREVDPNHDVFVGPVGMWMPFDPEAYKTGKVEYLEDELNQLMHEKDKNEKKAKNEFDKRVKESKKKAIEDNIAKAKTSGNKLTQMLNDEGNLVSSKDANTIDNKLDDDVAVSDIRKELFEGDNIITSKNKANDHGLSKLSAESQNNLIEGLTGGKVNKVMSDSNDDANDSSNVDNITIKAITDNDNDNVKD